MELAFQVRKNKKQSRISVGSETVSRGDKVSGVHQAQVILCFLSCLFHGPAGLWIS